MPHCRHLVRCLPFAVSVAAAAVGCVDLAGGCGNQELTGLASPDGRRRAVVFERDCGATTGFTTQVSVLAAGVALPDRGGNVFSSAFGRDSTRGPVKGGPGGGPWVHVRWLATDTLEVRYDARATAFTREPSVAGVAVLFVSDSTP